MLKRLILLMMSAASLIGCAGVNVGGYGVTACVEPSAEFPQAIVVDVNTPQAHLESRLPAVPCSTTNPPMTRMEIK